MTTDVSEWLMRGHAAASIVFNDPIWAEQNYQMQRGERRRGDYDPPLPDRFVDALRDRQQRLNALEDLMIAQGRADDPPTQDRGAWAQPDADLILSRRLMVSGGIRWVPAALLAEFQALYATPLPSSIEAHHV